MAEVMSQVRDKTRDSTNRPEADSRVHTTVKRRTPIPNRVARDAQRKGFYFCVFGQHPFFFFFLQPPFPPSCFLFFHRDGASPRLAAPRRAAIIH